MTVRHYINSIIVIIIKLIHLIYRRVRLVVWLTFYLSRNRLYDAMVVLNMSFWGREQTHNNANNVKADKLALRYQCLENAFCTYCRSI